MFGLDIFLNVCSRVKSLGLELIQLANSQLLQHSYDTESQAKS